MCSLSLKNSYSNSDCYANLPKKLIFPHNGLNTAIVAEKIFVRLSTQQVLSFL